MRVHGVRIVARLSGIVALGNLATLGVGTLLPVLIASGIQGHEEYLWLSKSGWPEPKHRETSLKNPQSEPNFLAMVLKQIGKTKEELWSELKKFPVGNPETVGLGNADWVIGGPGKFYVLRYWFGFNGNRLERIYIENRETAPSSLISPEEFAWPKQVKVFTTNWHIDAALKQFKDNGGKELQTRLKYILDAPLPNGTTIRFLCFAESGVPRWITSKEEFDPVHSKTNTTWSWKQPLGRPSWVRTTSVLVASKDWWDQAEKGTEPYLHWRTRSVDFGCGQKRFPVPMKIVLKEYPVKNGSRAGG